MIRSAFAALLAAAFACLVHDTVRERCRDALLPNPDLSAVGLVAGVTALIWLLIMLCRDPVEAEPAYTVQQHVTVTRSSPAPDERLKRPTGGYTVQPPRDAAGRFVKVEARPTVSIASPEPLPFRVVPGPPECGGWRVTNEPAQPAVP